MNQATREIIATLCRPLQSLVDQDFKSLPNVKNLSAMVMTKCNSLKDQSLDGVWGNRVHAVETLFANFEAQSLEEKKKTIRASLALLQGQMPTMALPKKETTLQTSAPKSIIDFTYVPSDHPPLNLPELEIAYKKLRQSIQYAKGVGPALADKFRKNAMSTIFDLLHFLPHRYENRMDILKIANAPMDELVTITGAIAYAGTTYYRGSKRKMFEIEMEDDTGSIRLKWFRFYQGVFEKKYRKDQKIIVTGKLKKYQQSLEMHHPDIEIYAGDQDAMSFGKVVPVYREIGGLYQKTLRKVMYHAVMNHAQHRKGLLPQSICEKHSLLPPWKVLFHLHQPEDMLSQEDIDGLSRQLAFEELFYYALATIVRKNKNEVPGIAFDQATPRVTKLLELLPFELTDAQKNCFKEIHQNMRQPKAMNRLIQGDVGSGKTVVAFMAALVAIEHGRQAALMAPTELLAQQHAASIQKWATPLDVRVQTLVGKHTAKEKQEIVHRLKNGEIDLLIGTHALIEDYVTFQSLGLVIIDEQHRFGVRQKNRIRNQTQIPDVLVMSATPIPRSLAMTLFGDIDVSVISEMPRNRKRVETHVVQEAKRQEVYETIRQTVALGQQVFMVYPLVEASEHLDAKDAVSMAEMYQKQVFKDLRVGLLHGQMSSDEKDQTMQAFADHTLDILVSTTVIEVGIDIANATLIVIEHPERFGLAQLHQLRGRVGRGDQTSSCILLAPPNISMMAKKRLKNFSTIYDGFALAEEDLKQRGPGDFFGVAQSGMPNFSMAQFPRDMDLLEQTRREALERYNQDPDFADPENQILTWVLENLWKERLQYIDVA